MVKEIIEKIQAVQYAVQVKDIVYEYLRSTNQDALAHGESFSETAARLGADPVMQAADKRWHELNTSEFDVEKLD